MEFWNKQKEIFVSEVGSQPAETIMEGALQAEQLGLAINLDLVNQDVLDFAGQYTNEWWQRTSFTTQNALRSAITDNIATGAPLRVLERNIEPLFGRARAQTIASTETTRMYAEGNRRAYKSSGVRQVEFQTVRDARVDPLCDVLQGKVLSIDDEGNFPPIHPRCRCWIAPITTEGEVLTRAEPIAVVPKSIETQAREILSSARKARPVVTRKLNQVVKARDGELVGKEFAVKPEESLLRKMNSLVKEQQVSVESVGSNINDSLRYTMQFSKSNYARSSQAALADLQAAGYRVTRISNYWATAADEYQGMNVVMRSPSGKTFELQFHTSFSHRVKEANHIVYDKWRKMDDGPARDALKAQMKTNFSSVPVPPGSPEMSWANAGFEEVSEGVWKWI